MKKRFGSARATKGYYYWLSPLRRGCSKNINPDAEFEQLTVDSVERKN